MDRKEAKRAKATRLAAVDVVSESGIPADRGSNGSDTCSDTLHVSLRPAVIPSASIHAPVKCVPAAAG